MSRPVVLILGGSGFIGRAIQRHLHKDYDIITADLQPNAFHEGSSSQHHIIDQGNPEDVARLLSLLEPNAERLVGAIHLTAYYDFRNQPDRRYTQLEQTFPQLLRGLDGLLPAGVPILHSSSMAAMEPTEPGSPLTASSPRIGSWAYPKHNLAMERILESSALKRPVAELVLAGVYSDRAELVPLFQQIERLRRRRPEALFFPGNTDRGLTYVHIDDTADAFACALIRLRNQPRVHRLLIGEDSAVTYREIHERASQAFHGYQLPLIWVPRWLAATGAAGLGWVGDRIGVRRFLRAWMVPYAGEHFEFDIAPTTNSIGWQPQVRLSERLPAILDFAKNNPTDWLSTNQARPW
ncbi:MAG: NAD(P)-dependent oxidoreductase [Myxococcota bacterium]|nr:NAD(P)-dependent oxidoreductase [Myxococcota bacterium]